MRKQSAIKSLPPPTPPPLRGRVRERGKNEQGFVLVVALLALLVVTVIGVLALSTSTTEVMIAGNARLREVNLSSADAGVKISEPVMRNPDRNKYTFLTTSEELSLKSEIFCSSTLNSDAKNFTITIGGNTVDVDVDFVNAGDPGHGYALEWGPPILDKNFVINSRSAGSLGSEAEIGALYHIVGYCD